MKNALLIFVAFFATALPLFCVELLDYSDSRNWFICEKDKPGTSYDLLYVYPTLSNAPDRTILDPTDAKCLEKILQFAQAQTGICGQDARIFAPLVRQLEYQAIIKLMNSGDKLENSPDYQVGVQDARAAFEYYRQNFQQGRPFIFFGHSQGAMEIYTLLKMCPEYSPDHGFVAAYLIGLPKITTKQILDDFAGRGISHAQACDDLGVIIVWNTQNQEAKSSLFTVANGYCINPLNWKTDGTPATADENAGAFFYDYRTGACRSVPHFCGARIDNAKGALIVELPSDSEWDAKGFMGKGLFHMYDVWFFAENTRLNMLLRARKYLEKQGK